MKSDQASTRTEAENEQVTTGPETVPVKVSKLRAAYDDADGVISEAAEWFEDASYDSVRRWLIQAGIHEPQTREQYSTAAWLEDVSPDAVTRDHGVEEAR